MDRVILNQKLSGLDISFETRQFLSKKGISLDAFSFDLDVLRDLFKENKTLFYHVINELSLYGCDYHSSKNSSFFPSPVGQRFKKIFCSSEDPLSTNEINELRLWKLFSEYEKKNKKSLNGICVDRFCSFVGERFGEEEFSKYSYLLIDNKEETNLLPDSINLGNLVIPKFYARFITSLWACDDKLLELYRNDGIIFYKDFLNLNQNDIERIVCLIQKNIDDSYEAGIYCYNFCEFIKEKTSFEELLKNYGINEELFFDYKTAIDSMIIQQIKNELLFTLDFFEYSVDTFLKINKQINNLFFPSPCMPYLKRFGVSDLSSFRVNIFESELGFYRFDDLPNSILTYNYNPFLVLEYLSQEIDGSHIQDERALDCELLKHSFDYNFDNFKNELIGPQNSESKLKTTLDIISMRDRGITLEEIGKMMGVTRERIRQIAYKFLDRNKKHYVNLLKMMFENADAYSETQYFKMIGLSEFVNSNYNTTGIIFNERLGLIIRESDSKKINDYIESNSKKVGFNVFNTSMKLQNQNINFAGFFLKESRNLVFNPYPSFTTIKRASAVDVAYLYLGEKGLKGFDAKNDIDEARKFFANYEPEVMQLNDRALIGRIQRVDYVLVGMSHYARTDFITEEIKNTIKEVMESYPINKQYGTVAREIYLKNEKILMSAGIDNYYFLYGVASKWKMCKYTYAGRSMRIFCGKELSFNQIVFRYISAHGPIVKSKQLCDDLGVREVGIEQVDFVSKFDPDTYILDSFIKFDGYQSRKLIDFIDKRIKLNGYCLAKEVLDGELFYDSSFNSFFRINQINNSPSRMAYAIEIVFKEMKLKKYKISHMIHCVSLNTNPIFTTADVAHQHFQDNEFSKEELFEFLDSVELGGEVTRKEFLKNYVVKVWENGYVVAKEYSINDKEMEYLCSILDEHYGSEICITANEALNRMSVFKIKHSFNQNPIGFCSAVTFYEKGNWIRPRNNVNYDNTKISVLLANRKFFNNKEDITISNVIRKTVMSINKAYLSYNDVSEFLLNNEITSSALPYDVFKQIFAEDIENNGLVRIKNES